MKLKTRLIITALTIWITVMALCLSSGAGVFFSQMANGTCDYYTMTNKDLKKNLPVNGTCYVVIDCIATYVTEETNKTTGKTTEKDSAYYYIVPLDEEYLMLVKTSANSQLTYDFDCLVDAFWDEEDSPYYYMMDTGTKLDGILVKNDSDVVSYYNEWCDEMEVSDQDGYALAAYTLDCTQSVSGRIKQFWIGSIMLLFLLGIVTILVVSYFKKKKTVSYSTSSYGSVSYGNNYSGINSSQSSGAYDPTSTYSSSNSAIPHSNFQSQGVQNTNSYGISNYGSTGSSYGQFQSQGGQNSNNYGTSNYGSTGSSYGQFQSQGGQSSNNYGTSNYSSTGSSYGQFQSQGIQNSNSYGTSNYGSTGSSYGQFQSQGGQSSNNYGISSYGSTADSVPNSYSSQATVYAENEYSSNYDDSSNNGY